MKTVVVSGATWCVHRACAPVSVFVCARACVCVRARVYVYDVCACVCVKNDRLWYVWMTEATAVANGDGDGATVLVGCVERRGWGAGPWNKSIPNGRETDADGRTGKRRPGSRLPSAIPHRLILCCAPVHVFLRLQFQFAFYTVLLQHRVAAAALSLVFPPRSLVGLDAEPLARACYISHKCCSN